MSDLKEIFDSVVQDKIRTVPGKARIIETARKSGRLIAVSGNYDYVEKILPHCYAAEKTLVKPRQAPPSLDDVDVVFVGCPGKLQLNAWQVPLESFLAAGGVMLTTDWCLQNLVEPMFPWAVGVQGTAQGSFPLRVRRPGHRLLEGITDCGGTPWVVEAASHRIGIRDTKQVELILDAPTMGEPSAVLVAFPVGKGLVVHAISHFHLQGSEKTGEYISAFILTNVIDEAIRRRHVEKPAPRVRVIPRGKPAPSTAKPLRIKVRSTPGAPG